MAKGQNLLVFHFHSHLQLDHILFRLVALTFNVVYDLVPGDSDFLLEGLDFLFEQVALFCGDLCVLMRFEKLFFHLNQLFRRQVQFILCLLCGDNFLGQLLIHLFELLQMLLV